MASLLALGATGLTQCVDGTGPAGGSSTFGFTPGWKSGASRAMHLLEEGGLPLDRVRIILVRPVADTLKDTTITVHRGDPQIDLPLHVNVTPGVVLQVTLQFKSGETILFQGTSPVTTVPLNRTPVPTTLPMDYVGPGKDATKVIVSPASGSFFTNANITFTASVADDANTVFPNTPIDWNVTDPTMGSFIAGGVFVPAGKVGPATITATTPTGITGSATITLQAPIVATAIAIVSGQGQSGTIGSALPNPFVVKVTNAAGNGIAGIAVSWNRTAGSGTPATATSTTDAQGNASFQYTLGSTPGAETIVASAVGLTATFNVTAVAAGPAAITMVSGNAQTDSVLKELPLPFVVKVTDASGNPVNGATVSWTRTGGFGTPANATSTTNAAGLASLVYRLGDVGGADTVVASVSGLTGTVTFVATVKDGLGLPIATGFAYLLVKPSPVTARVGDTVSFTVDSVSATGQATPVTALTWASSNPGRGAVDATGKMIVADTGAIIVTATRNAITGHARATALAAPKVTAFSFAPKVLNGITNSPLTFSLTFGGVDAGTGITSATFTLTGPTGTTQTCTATTPTTGHVRNGTFDCAITLPAGSPPGAWHVTSLVINGSITRTFGEGVLALFGTTTLTVNP